MTFLRLSVTPTSPGVLLVLSIELVGLQRFLRHPAGHQLLVVLCGLPQFLLQGGEGDLQGIVLVLQRLIGLLQLLQGSGGYQSHMVGQ